jgi:hypothetical protein
MAFPRGSRANGDTVSELVCGACGAKRILVNGYPEDAKDVAPSARPRRGRPAWTPELFWQRYAAAEALAAEPRTYGSIAPHFVQLDGAADIDPDYLGALFRRFSPRPE